MSAEITVNSNPDIALSGYVLNVLGLKKHPWTKRGPLAGVPDELIEKAAAYIELKSKISFQQHPLTDLSSQNQSTKNLIKEIEQLHNRQLDHYTENIQASQDFLQKVLDRTEGQLADVIEQSTRISWPFEQVYLVPSLYQGGTVHGQYVFMGFFPGKPGKKNASGVIHELVHVNTYEASKPLRQSLKLPTDSIEAATVLVTNKAVHHLNHQIKSLDLTDNSFSTYYRDYILDHGQNLTNLATKHVKYAELVQAIDQYFIDNKYPGYFKQHGI